MAALITKQLSQRVCATAWRAFSSQVTDKPYWHSIFPDGQPRSFDDIPTIQEKNYDLKKIHEISMQWFKKYGYVAKEWMTDDTCCVHLFHFEDFRTVYNNDGNFPIRKSHRVMRQYREERRDLYENVGLGAGEGNEWWDLRKLLRHGVHDKLLLPLMGPLEEVADDLVKILHIKSNEGEVDMLPWLFRWAFESAGVITLNRRLDALNEFGSEEADKMVEAAGITNEMIALTETDWRNYDQYYEKMAPAQDFMYSVIVQYLEPIEADPESKCIVKTLMDTDKNSKKNAITMTMDIFQGALQTVPLTVLMALYNLARNKHVQDAIRKEVEKQLPTRESRYFANMRRFKDDIPPYLSGVVWETLRINPPIIGNGRVLQEDLVLGGYRVPKGTNTILHQQVACLLEENFEEPSKFKPERHPTSLQLHLENVFGGKKRTCLGMNFALGQMALVLAKILRDFDVSYHGGEITMINRLHNEPEKPILFKLDPILY